MMSGALLPARRRPDHWSKKVPGVTATVMVTPSCAVWYSSANFLNVSSECEVGQELSTRLASSGPPGGFGPPEEPAPQAASARAPVPIAPPIRNRLLSIDRSNSPGPTSLLSPYWRCGARSGAIRQPRTCRILVTSAASLLPGGRLATAVQLAGE